MNGYFKLQTINKILLDFCHKNENNMCLQNNIC